MSDDPRTLATRRRLLDATMQTIREQGMAKLSARTIAATGSVNQALVFYHFGTVDGLVAEACHVLTSERVDRHRPALDAVTTWAGLIDVAEQVRADEREEGNGVAAAVDGGLKHLALGREPEPVIDKFGIARHQLVLLVRGAAVKRDGFHRPPRRPQRAPRHPAHLTPTPHSRPLLDSCGALRRPRVPRKCPKVGGWGRVSRSRRTAPRGSRRTGTPARAAAAWRSRRTRPTRTRTPPRRRRAAARPRRGRAGRPRAPRGSRA